MTAALAAGYKLMASPFLDRRPQTCRAGPSAYLLTLVHGGPLGQLHDDREVGEEDRDVDAELHAPQVDRQEGVGPGAGCGECRPGAEREVGPQEEREEEQVDREVLQGGK